MKLPWHKHEFQRNSGSREMVRDDDGEWVHRDVVAPILEAAERIINSEKERHSPHNSSYCTGCFLLAEYDAAVRAAEEAK